MNKGGKCLGASEFAVMALSSVAAPILAGKIGRPLTLFPFFYK
jgi:hypothetical protein